MPYSNGWYPSAPPTPASLSRIEKTLGLRIPAIYAELARVAPNYGVWFGSIGPDFDSHNHILKLNEAFHRGDDEFAPLPPNFILLNHGHDGDCDCWNLEELVAGEHAIFHVNVERKSAPRLLATSFLAYWKDHT
jgi:hypothetical protein